jgi:hypothetical protein
MADSYQYQVFISYSSKDREWARRMEQDLRARGVDKIFLDERTLETGLPWAPALKDAVRASRHLLVLWSKNASSSQWVAAEMAQFDIVAGEATTGSRRMLCVLLDEEDPFVYASLQAEKRLREKPLYQTGIAGFTPELSTVWNDVAGDLAEIILTTGDETPIQLAIVAMTREEAKQLDLNQTLGGRVEPLAKQLAALGLQDLAALEARYGERRRDWRPFGGDRTLRQVQDELLGKINQLLPDRKFRWQEVDILSGDFETAKSEVGKLTSDLTVVLIDPLSLYNPNITFRFSLFQSCFQREQSVILTLAPFRLPSALSDLRKLVYDASTPLLDFFYEPPVPSERCYYACNLDACDPSEIRRTIWRRLGLYAREITRDSAHPFLDPRRA